VYGDSWAFFASKPLEVSLFFKEKPNLCSIVAVNYCRLTHFFFYPDCLRGSCPIASFFAHFPFFSFLSPLRQTYDTGNNPHLVSPQASGEFLAPFFSLGFLRTCCCPNSVLSGIGSIPLSVTTRLVIQPLHPPYANSFSPPRSARLLRLWTFLQVGGFLNSPPKFVIKRCSVFPSF